MIFDTKNTKGKGTNVQVFDAQGLLIPSAFKYNTRTRAVSMYLTGRHPTNKNRSVLTKKIRPKKGQSLAWEILKVTVKIPGSYIVVDGKKY